jgi:hypothetical protein
MSTLDLRKFPPVKIPLLVGLAVALTTGQLVTPRQGTPVNDAKTRDGNTPIPPEYVCLDEAVKATAPDGSTIFVLLQAKHSECESAVMPSPLSEEDRDLLYKMSVDASNIAALYMADEVREAHGDKRTWASMIETGVSNFRRMRTRLCARHPDMFVYQLKDSGERTAPKSCTKE